MKVIEVSIKKGEWLLDALKRIGYDMIPANTILDKTLTGLGATHSEIHAKRNSIVILPSVSIILCKLDDNDNLEAVYEKCTPYSIKKYLQMDITYKKILCTPESFYKIRKAAKELNIDLYKEYFCLFDECERITQDIIYRRKIAQPIYDFFQFENKAFVSATPLEMSHKEFENQKFQKIKIVPDYDYTKNLNLIITNSYYKSLKVVLDQLKDSKHICIFFNVTDGICQLIENLKISDYKIFCSQKSVNKLINKGIQKSYSKITYPLSKYNFFTCRFYSGLDIISKQKPDIIILTDFNSANWTMIDPFTEAIQIQGRFRKITEDETYNSLTHISTIRPEMKIRSKDDIEKRINQIICNYNQFKNNYDMETDIINKEVILEDMQKLTYEDLLDERGEINPFTVDNLYNEERVKSYYVSVQSLYKAYLETGFFNVSLIDATQSVGDDDIKRLNKAKSNRKRWEILVSLLENVLHDFEQGIISAEKKDDFLSLLKEQPESNYIINVYFKIGKVGIENANYRKTQMDKSVRLYEKEQAEILRFSPEVKKTIKEEFELNVYINKNELMGRLIAIYNEYGIKYKVIQDTIRDYYKVSNSGSIKGGSYKLERFKE